ncbi:MAG: GAF domain-containing protein, partial [Chloroflexi bacterium]
MIWRWLRRFFTIQHNYTNPVMRMKASGLLIVSWFLLLLWLAGMAAAFYNLAQGQDVAELGLRFFITLIATPLLIFSAQYFLQHGQFNFAAQAVVGLLFINALPLELVIDFRIILSAVLTLIAAALLLPRIAYILVGGVLGLTIIGVGLLPLEVAPTTQQLTIIIILTAAIAIVLYIFGVQPQHIAEQSHLDYSRLLELNRFARDIETIDERDTLLNTTIHLITQRFHYAFAQVYLIDEQYTGGQLLRVRAGLGLDRGTVTGRVRLRDTSGILEAIRTRKSVLLTREDNELRRDYFLAATDSAIAIPLVYGEDVLGVLDVQTSENAPFSEHALALLETVANLITGKLHELEERAEIRKAMQEQTQITNTLRQQLNELRKQSHGTVSSTWE